MRIAHLSDFHFTYLTRNPLRLFSKRLIGQFNWIFNRDREFSSSQLDPLIDLFSTLGVDLVLLGGDFTTTALPVEFTRAQTFAKRLQQPWIAIPGNHDKYTHRSHRNRRYYRYFTNTPPSFGSLEREGVEGHCIAPGWWVVALDTARPTSVTSSRGLFSEDREAAFKACLAQIPAQDRIIVFNHYPFFQNEPLMKTLERGDVLEQLLRRDGRICLYLHGHTHRHIMADLQSDGLPIVLDSGSCAQGPKGAWNLIDLSDAGCSISVYRWNQHWYKSKTEEFAWNRGLTPA